MSEPLPTSPPHPVRPSGVAHRWSYAVLIFAVLLVLMPFLFWQSTWFGRPLDDQQMAEYLAAADKPRKIQHALAQIGDRMIDGDASVRRWYPEVVRLAGHPMAEIRITAAWVMGQQAGVPEFHATLLELLGDRNPMVRRNAALALVRYGDDSGRAELLAMLQPYAVTATAVGTLQHRLQPGDTVNPGTLLARLQQGGEVLEVRSPVPGTVKRWVAGNLQTVVPGDVLVEISPSPEMVWEALRALVLVGQPEDLELVNRYANGVPEMPARIALQAAETIRAIRARQPN
jgi:hypothetical protein